MGNQKEPYLTPLNRVYSINKTKFNHGYIVRIWDDSKKLIGYSMTPDESDIKDKKERKRQRQILKLQERYFLNDLFAESEGLNALECIRHSDEYSLTSKRELAKFKSNLGRITAKILDLKNATTHAKNTLDGKALEDAESQLEEANKEKTALISNKQISFVLDSLPSEFFSHDIYDLDINDEQQLFDFTLKWGLLYSPMRSFYSYQQFRHNYYEKRWRLSAWAYTSDNKELEPKIPNKNFFHDAAIARTDEVTPLKYESDSILYMRDFISIDEVRASIKFYQDFANCLFDNLSPEKEWPNKDWSLFEIMKTVINKSAYQPMQFETAIDRPTASLTSLVSAQILRVCASSEKWIKCQCTDSSVPCKRYFKRRYYENRNENQIKRQRSESLMREKYCCKKCCDNQTNANKKKSRNRLDTGA